MIVEPMDCVDLVELVTAYLEDAVDTQTRTRIAAHLEICSGCAEYVAQLRESIRLTGGLVDDDIDPEFRRRLLRAFRDWHRL